jgi:hypothetical protein
MFDDFLTTELEFVTVKHQTPEIGIHTQTDRTKTKTTKNHAKNVK